MCGCVDVQIANVRMVDVQMSGCADVYDKANDLMTINK